jgi:integrase/recombinase XerC
MRFPRHIRPRIVLRDARAFCATSRPRVTVFLMEPTISAIISKYLAWCGKHRSPRSLEWYEGHLAGFLAHLGVLADMPVAALKPFHLVEWVDSHDRWGNTYKRGAIVAVQRSLNWAEELGYIESHSLKKIKKPPAGRRDNPVMPEDFQTILARLPERDPFRDLFLFLWHSGCRPQEARHIEPRHVQLDQERVIIPKEEAKGKRYPRVIYLNSPALEIVTRLLALRTASKLFRNTRGDPWTKYAVCNRMHRLSRACGIKKAAYDLRHGFATRKLVQGHDHLTVAEILGHRDGTMLSKVYGHLDRHTAHLKKALQD